MIGATRARFWAALAALLILAGIVIAIQRTAITTDGGTTPLSTPTSSIHATPPPQEQARAWGRRGFWYAIGRAPTSAELDAAPRLYGVVVLNLWEKAALKRLKQLDPSIVVLAYQDLSSARSYDSGSTPPAGVTWAQAMVNPKWLATDTSGRRIEWSGYPEHWQTAVWDPAYQRAWAANVTQRVVTAGFDGVLADNAVSTLKWYSDQLLAGTSSSAETDAKLRSGIQALIELAGPTLRAKGKLLVPNVSDARLYPGRWASLARWGGAMEENLAHFGTSTDPSSFVTDWGDDGWDRQTSELSHPGLSLAVTRAAPGDLRTLRYGYASLLVRGDATSYWQPLTSTDSNIGPQVLSEQRWATGPARDAGKRVGAAWTRTYAGVWAAVNPTQSLVTITAPAGATDAGGAPVRTVQLSPANGVVLRLP